MSHREFDELAVAAIRLYREEIQPLVHEHNPAAVALLAPAVQVLEAALAQKQHIHVGFVGEAQVGKSTLINAFLDRYALPSGGVGPLTAQATRVSYADEDSLTATYHPIERLRELRFSVETLLVRRGEIRLNPGDSDAALPVDAADADLTSRTAPEGEETTESTDREGAADYNFKQARQMLCDGVEGLDSSEVGGALVLDGIRSVLGQNLRGEQAALGPLRGRIDAIRAKLGVTEQLRESALGSQGAFDRELELRAAGWMAPLVSELKLSLNAEALRPISLVDLPGIGVLGDAAAKVAENFVTKEGDALVLVARNNGLTEALKELLESTGVITKLLFGGRQGEPAIRVVIAVTHLDDVARTHYRKAVQQLPKGEPQPNRDEIFGSLARDMATKIKSQLGELLRTSDAFQDLSDAWRGRREAVVSQLCEAMQVFCVASPDYFSLRDDDGDGFLRTEAGTGIPALRDALQGLAQEVRLRRSAAVHTATQDLLEILDVRLAEIGQMYEEQRGKATAEWDRFRQELERETVTLEQHMAAHHGESIGFLRTGIPQIIKSLCQDVQLIGLKRLDRLCRSGNDLHYQSLNAALRNDGVWDRRGINYPKQLTLAMVDAVASDWEPKVIETVRATMRKLAERDGKLVERLCEQAQRWDGRIVADAQIDTQKKILQQQSRTCVAWTRDRIDHLREEVQADLVDAVAGPIAAACRSAVLRRRNVNSGAKQKILEDFRSGGTEAIAKARDRAERVLVKNYEHLFRDLNAGYLAEHHNPVRAAFDALTNEELARARRSDRRRAKQVMELVAELRGRVAKVKLAPDMDESVEAGSRSN